MSETERYDVVAVSTEDYAVLWADGPHDRENAEAVVKMAVMRQGVVDRFFVECAHGAFKAGDRYAAKRRAK